ncbi:MAG: TPM domain-containing protein [Sphingobacterium sp.]|uniref:TPM domain-containing protein n=1 Tax=Sphingobacterium sp. JB170 TaxID=1434842 RepID=UPI00097EEF27|nr:TPM domain-containing protein [Sphingobacterium sp. JB170]SJN42563.1 Hypothetical protein FM107_11695 [Sphingobacterium sp. JB170]
MELFSTEDQDRIVQAISVAESKTSGEIRLVVDRRLKHDSALDAAVTFFKKLKMHETALRNGVLIYLAVDDHKFAIIGDKGISDVVGEHFWDQTKEHMLSFFKQDDVPNGLIAGIHDAGEKLYAFFPRRSDDINELPDDIYYGNN